MASLAQAIRNWVVQADRQEGRREEQAEARMACFGFIEGWYDPVRLHSGLGYRSPIAYETAMAMTIAEP